MSSSKDVSVFQDMADHARDEVAQRAALLVEFLEDGGAGSGSHCFMEGGLFMLLWAQHRLDALLPAEQAEEAREASALGAAVWEEACRTLQAAERRRTMERMGRGEVCPEQVEECRHFLGDAGVDVENVSEDFRLGGMLMMAYAAARIGRDGSGEERPSGYEDVAADRASVVMRLWERATAPADEG